MSRPRFRRVDRDQRFLLPPDVREWLPAGHPALFVVEFVSQVDLSGFVAGYRSSRDRGRPAYHPEVMVGIVLYASMTRVQSSRQIARLAVTDAGFRVVAANERPDHSTISRFLVRHGDALAGLFEQVVGLGAEAGVVDPVVVALDGTTLPGDVSLRRNVAIGRLRERFVDWADDVAGNDAAEDAADAAAEAGGEDDEGGRSGPVDDMLTSESMREWIRRRLLERRDDPDDARLNVVDPDSAVLLRKGGGWVQGYNAQAAAVPGGFVVAVDVTDNPSDSTMLSSMVAKITTTVTHATGQCPDVVVADAGYWSAAVIDEINADDDLPDVLIPPHSKLPAQVPDPLPEPDQAGYEAVCAANRAAADAERARRAVVIARVVAGELLLRQAAVELGVSIATAGRLKLEWIAAGGPEGMTIRTARASRPRGPTKAARARHEMESRLARPTARSIYRQRQGTIEPVFGDLKTNRRINRFLRRGITKVRADLNVMMIGHNLTLLHNATT